RLSRPLMPWASRDRVTKRRADARYGAAWRRARLAALQRARWRCELRLPGCAGAATEVDHIDGAEADPNHERLRAVCSPCHRNRTAEQAHGARWGGGASAKDPDCTPRTAW